MTRAAFRLLAAPRNVAVAISMVASLNSSAFAQGSEKVVDDVMNGFSFIAASIWVLGVCTASLLASRCRVSISFLVTLAGLAVLTLGLMAWHLEISTLWPTFLAMVVVIVAPIAAIKLRTSRRVRD